MKILTDNEHRIFLAAMIREMEYCKKLDKEIKGCKELVPICSSIIDKVDNAESVRHGHWIKYEHGSGIYCSECRHKRRYRDMYDNYCPNCGTKMDGENHE